MKENKDKEYIDESVGTMADVEAVMKKYDRESNVRIWEGLPRTIIHYLMAAFAIYCIIDAIFLTTLQEVRYSVFMGMIVLLGFLTFPVRKGVERVNHMPWYDIIIMVVGAGAYFFYAANAMTVIRMSARIMADPLFMVVGAVGILALVELCRRCVGLPILCVAGALVIYTLASGIGVTQLIRTLFYTANGIFSTPVGVCVKYIVIFIIFGAFLERTGVADFFIRFANTAVGRFTGGPAKVAVVASALEGMASGSSVANTVGSGSITIPMMKKMGYRPEFAAAVEAAASTGGQIMPPIMGAAAFLMAEFTGIPYGQIAVMAILPAVLYFTGIFIAVHLEAKRSGMQGIPREHLPKVKDLLKELYLLLPLIALIYLVGTNTFTMAYSATLSILVAMVVGVIHNIVPHFTATTDGGEEEEAGQKPALVRERRPQLDHGRRRMWNRRHHLGLHHGHGTRIHPAGRHRIAVPRHRDDRPGADDAVLHRPGHGRSDDRQLLHHGRRVRTDPHSSWSRACGGPLLRLLLRHRRGHNPACGPGCICGQRHREVGSDEDGTRRNEAGDRRLRRAIRVRAEPRYALRERYKRVRGLPDLRDRASGHLRHSRRAERLSGPTAQHPDADHTRRRRTVHGRSRHDHRHDRTRGPGARCRLRIRHEAQEPDREGLNPDTCAMTRRGPLQVPFVVSVGVAGHCP